MARYRMSLEAHLFFTVEAGDAKEAIEKAIQIRDDIWEGIDVQGFDEGRLYCSGNDVPIVEDVERD